MAPGIMTRATLQICELTYDQSGKKAMNGSEDSRDPGVTTISSASMCPGKRKGLAAMGSLLAALSTSGCQTDAQILASEQERATQTALRRGQFELDCPQATPTILSSNLLQAGRYVGYLHAEYTIGVAGCGQRRTYTVICRVSDSACSTLPDNNR